MFQLIYKKKTVTRSQAGHICGDANDLIDGVPTGSVRISIGYMTAKANVDAVITMITECYVQNTKPVAFDRNTIPRLYKLDKVPQPKCRLKQICVYPIKSCGALKITTKWPITRRGLKYDREWMIVNGNGVAVTQKTDTKLCLIMPAIDEERNSLELSFPYMASIRIRLRAVDSDGDDRRVASVCQSKVCNDRIDGIDCGDEVANWLSDALCTDALRLIRQSNADKRRFTKKASNGKYMQ